MNSHLSPSNEALARELAELRRERARERRTTRLVTMAAAIVGVTLAVAVWSGAEAGQITYADKTAGQAVLAADFNDIKAAVNDNDTRIDALENAGFPITKANVYKNTATATAAANDGAAAIAMCDDANDVLMGGGCDIDQGPAGRFTRLGANGPYNDTMVSSTFRCVWQNESSSTVTFTAQALCLSVP